jgi:SpoVK/Ycf46/Vps4 family AAA+-type ATPase
MYSEILRIIEGGLNNDRRKIINYSNRLANHFEKDGDINMAKCILSAIQQLSIKGSTMDELRSVPIDNESHLKIVEVIPENQTRTQIVLSSLVKKQIEDFIELINHQDQLELHGIEIQKTLLLYGQPGCGKTSIAHYISEKTKLPLVIAKLDAVVSSLLGNTAKNISRIFDYAEASPCILFLDEFDAIAKARDDEHELGELKRVINSLLQNIDSFSPSSILIAATNHSNLLDKAVWRRFQTTIEVGIPDEYLWKELLGIIIGDFDCDFKNEERRMEQVIKLLYGKTPSDIKTIFNKVKAQSVVKGINRITLLNLLLEIYNFNNNNANVDDLVKYLYKNGITQSLIAENLGISLRQVKNDIK